MMPIIKVIFLSSIKIHIHNVLNMFSYIRNFCYTYLFYYVCTVGFYIIWVEVNFMLLKYNRIYYFVVHFCVCTRGIYFTMWLIKYSHHTDTYTYIYTYNMICLVYLHDIKIKITVKSKYFVKLFCVLIFSCFVSLVLYLFQYFHALIRKNYQKCV